MPFKPSLMWVESKPISIVDKKGSPRSNPPRYFERPNRVIPQSIKPSVSEFNFVNRTKTLASSCNSVSPTLKLRHNVRPTRVNILEYVDTWLVINFICSFVKNASDQLNSSPDNLGNAFLMNRNNSWISFVCATFLSKFNEIASKLGLNAFAASAADTSQSYCSFIVWYTDLSWNTPLVSKHLFSTSVNSFKLGRLKRGMSFLDMHVESSGRQVRTNCKSMIDLPCDFMSLENAPTSLISL